MDARRARCAAGEALLLGLLVAVALGCGDASQPAPAAPAIVASTRTLTDASRGTPANGPSYPGAAVRTLETRLWVAESPPPGAAACTRDGCGLVVLAHGYGGSTARFDALGRFLAAAGFVVAAPTFPLTNEAAPGGHLTATALGDVVQQPADVAFVVEQLLAASATEGGDPLAGRVDPARVGAIGHSLGGATVLAATRLACCAVPRLTAVVAVAPVWALLNPYFHAEPEPAGPPTLIVNGSDDTTVRPASSIDLFERIEPPRILLEVSGAHHSDLIENTGPPEPVLEPTEQAARAFFDAVFAGRQAALDATLRDLEGAGNAVRRD